LRKKVTESQWSEEVGKGMGGVVAFLYLTQGREKKKRTTEHGKGGGSNKDLYSLEMGRKRKIKGFSHLDVGEEGKEIPTIKHYLISPLGRERREGRGGKWGKEDVHPLLTARKKRGRKKVMRISHLLISNFFMWKWGKGRKGGDQAL